MVIKLIPVGKEGTIAEVQDHEIVKSSGFRAQVTHFKDKSNQSYTTKKGRFELYLSKICLRF